MQAQNGGNHEVGTQCVTQQTAFKCICVLIPNSNMKPDLPAMTPDWENVKNSFLSYANGNKQGLTALSPKLAEYL